MCTGKCARFVGLSLIPLSLVCIVANALLLVPNAKTTWTKDHLSLQVWLMAGFIGGGLMVRSLGGCGPLSRVLNRREQEREKLGCREREAGAWWGPGGRLVCPQMLST